MRSVRQSIGGLGNLMFKQAFLMEAFFNEEIPDLYVQGEKYWKKHAQEIKSFFSEGIGYTDKVAIHIRRGDYLRADHFHVNLGSTDYYKKALQMFPDEQFLVFCRDNQGEEQDMDDKYWCDKYLQAIIPGRYTFVPHGTSETEDLNLMASCKSIIMANSSFSWWAAYLNPNPNKRVICPAQWFVDGVQRTELLDEWIKI